MNLFTFWKRGRDRKGVNIMVQPLADQVIPAAVGYMRLSFTFLERKPTVDHILETVRATTTPIIGWRILDGLTLPVALGGDLPADTVAAIMIPNGAIFDANGKSWKGLPAWAQDCLAAWKIWLPARPQKPAPPVRPLQSGEVVFGARPVGFLEDAHAPRIA
jgi:hypothetical protein